MGHCELRRYDPREALNRGPGSAATTSSQLVQDCSRPSQADTVPIRLFPWSEVLNLPQSYIPVRSTALKRCR